MSKESAKTFEVVLKGSNAVGVLILTLILLAYLACWLTGLSLLIKTLLTISLSVYLIFYLQRFFAYRDYSELRLIKEKSWDLKVKNGTLVKATALPSSLILGPLFLLHFKTSEKVVYITLLENNINKEAARDLRLYFKHVTA